MNSKKTMTAYNIEDAVNLLPEYERNMVVQTVADYENEGKEPTDVLVYSYLGVAVWHMLKAHIDTLKEKINNEKLTND